MRTIFTILTGLLLATASNSQTIECERFKNGRFYYPANRDVISLRKDTIQESYNKGVLEMVWKVKWLNECEYEMLCTKIIPDPYPLAVGDRITVTITGTDAECFTFKSTYYDAASAREPDVRTGMMCIEKDK